MGYAFLSCYENKLEPCSGEVRWTSVGGLGVDVGRWLLVFLGSVVILPVVFPVASVVVAPSDLETGTSIEQNCLIRITQRTINGTSVQYHYDDWLWWAVPFSLPCYGNGLSSVLSAIVITEPTCHAGC